jgi:hypothetical protein
MVMKRTVCSPPNAFGLPSAIYHLTAALQPAVKKTGSKQNAGWLDGANSGDTVEA